MSIVKVQSVAPVHFRVGRCHQMKKRHRMWLLSKVFTDLEKVFSLKWGCPPREAFHWRRGERSSLATCVTHYFPGGTSSKEPACQCRRARRPIWSLSREDPLEEGIATHSGILAWRISWTVEPGWLQSIGSQTVGHDWNHLAHVRIYTHVYLQIRKPIGIFISKYYYLSISLFFVLKRIFVKNNPLYNYWFVSQFWIMYWYASMLYFT